MKLFSLDEKVKIRFFALDFVLWLLLLLSVGLTNTDWTHQTAGMKDSNNNIREVQNQIYVRTY